MVLDLHCDARSTAPDALEHTGGYSAYSGPVKQQMKRVGKPSTVRGWVHHTHGGYVVVVTTLVSTYAEDQL